MEELKLSDIFKLNLLHYKIFGIWPTKNLLYNCYLIVFLSITLFIYNILLIFNLLCTPRNIEIMIPEFNFLCTEIAVMAKVFMILLMRNKLLACFNILDCEAFKGNDETSRRIVQIHVSKYKTYWKMLTIISHFAYSCQVFLPIILHLIFDTNMELPICKYYFLDDEVVRGYFTLWYIYQSFGIYGHMQYNINTDTLIGGLLIMAICQVKILKYKMANLKHPKSECTKMNDEGTEMIKLNKYLKHYDALLNYCIVLQDIIGIAMFVMFSMASVIICVMMCELLLPSTIGELMFKISYLFTIVSQIYVPAWLGTQLSEESQELVSAAYSSEWIPRSERFKRSLKLFMARANTKIMISGWRLFPLSLDTFTSILKTAYSFFTLIRNIQDRQQN